MKITKAINIYLWLFTVIIALDIFTPSARSTATNGRTPTLFNIDGVCLRRDAGNQREVGFGQERGGACDSQDVGPEKPLKFRNVTGSGSCT